MFFLFRLKNLQKRCGTYQVQIKIRAINDCNGYIPYPCFVTRDI